MNFENLETIVLTLALASYLMSFVLYLINFFKSNEQFQRVGKIFVLFAFIATTLAICFRTWQVGHLPFSNMFEFTLSFLWGAVMVFLVVEFKFNLSGLGMFFAPLAVIMVMWLLIMDKGNTPLMPALRSKWLFIHVFTAIIAYGAFAVSFITALIYLLKEKGYFQWTLPSLEVIDQMTYKIISVAMPFMTLVLITGAIWAEAAWGKYWSWDPKETWALITWLIYAGYLHARLVRGWNGRRAIILAVAGFAAVLFTFAGVTYLLPGMHSYAA